MRYFAIVAVAFIGGAWFTGSATAQADGSSPYNLVEQIARVLVLVENEYVDPVDRSRLLEGAIKGMVAELDPHSSYLSAEAFDTFRSDTDGQFGGVGLEVDFGNDEVTVIAAIEGSPAHRAGIGPGDKVVAIDRRRIRGKPANELVRMMRGAPGSVVQVSIRRRGADELLVFELQREFIEVSSIYSTKLADSLGYVRVKQFQRGTHRELLSALAKLRNDNAGSLRGLILDMRNNPGGLVKEAIAIADEFLNSGVIYSTRRREQTVDIVTSSRGGSLSHEPLVVLVNEFSASAAELVTGALQDNKRATVVGAPTFGKGSVQSIVDLANNAGLRLTILRYYTPAGRAIQAQGIRPDVLVEAAYAEDRSFRVLRERDLENHLPAEEQTADDNRRVIKPPSKLQEETGISPTHLGVARVVPEDPTGGPDFALSIGFQILRDVLAQSEKR